MPPFKGKAVGAIFDVKPVDDTGSVDVQKIASVTSIINLNIPRLKSRKIKKEVLRIEQLANKSKPSKNIKDQFQELLNNETDLEIELARFGGQPVNHYGAKPRYRIIQHKSLPQKSVDDPFKYSAAEDSEFKDILSEIHRSAKTFDYNYEQAAPLIESELTVAEVESYVQPILIRQKLTELRFNYNISRRKLAIAGAGFIIVAGVVMYMIHVKDEVVQQSAFAVDNLQTAHDDLKMLQFASASQDFIAAYDNFSKAGDSLNFMGATITGIIGELPGGSTVKSARNLLEAGRLLSNAGSAMTTAMEAIADSGGIFNPDSKGVAVGKVASTLQKALLISKEDISKASALLADIDSDIIPPDKQEAFSEFVSKLPAFKETVDQSADYAKFFKDLIESKGTKRYLVLFQNPSELRPTGGFPGTYGILTFKDGKLDDFFVDDIYNLDGQLKENFVPPRQLQHITPTWGMRDAAWFVDFPTSARKVQEFYKMESGQNVDGVIAVNPKIVSQVLEIVGAIDMPQYDVKLDSSNVMTTIQDQVEYKGNRVQPKQIVKDFAPLFLQKVYGAPSDQWLTIFNILVASMDERKILMFFNDLSLESFATEKGFGGQVKQVEGSDYVMPTISNVKGSKTDAVTDTSFDISTRVDGKDAFHTLTITRQHNGGDREFGFYNKQNPAYVRVLVPNNAEFVSITGNSQTVHQPLINYSGDDFRQDSDLDYFETNIYSNHDRGVITYQEAGKSEFGFWMVTDPRKTKTVTLTYRVPNIVRNNAYELLVQKQPGLEARVKFSISKDSDFKPVDQWSGAFTKDLQFKVNFR